MHRSKRDRVFVCWQECLFVVLLLCCYFVDGISDVLNRSQVGELVLALDQKGNSTLQISEFITSKAAQM